MIKINWQEDEVILLVDLYYTLKNENMSSSVQEVVELSEILNKRAEKSAIIKDDKYRNPTGIAMKLQNIRYIDTNGEFGLQGASQLDYSVMNKYHNNLEKLHIDALNIKQKYSI